MFCLHSQLLAAGSSVRFIPIRTEQGCHVLQAARSTVLLAQRVWSKGRSKTPGAYDAVIWPVADEHHAQLRRQDAVPQHIAGNLLDPAI